MLSLVDIPIELKERVFYLLDPYTLSLLSQCCRSLSSASQCTRYFKWIPQLPTSVIQSLPSRYPRLTQLRLFEELTLNQPFEPWEAPHQCLSHVVSDSLWIAPHLLKCPQLHTFEYCSFDYSSSHDMYFTHQVFPILFHLLPQLSVLAIRNMVSKLTLHLDKSLLGTPILCPNLTHLTLHISSLPLNVIHDFLSAFEFPAVTHVSLGRFKRVPQVMDWPFFVSTLKGRFPKISHLELDHQFVDVSDSLPPDLISLSWSTWQRRSNDIPFQPANLYLSKFVDPHPRLTKLLLTASSIVIHDDLLRSSYPNIIHLDIYSPLERFDRFPYLTYLTIHFKLEESFPRVLKELCFNCPLLEHLDLSVGYGSFQLRDDDQVPWFEKLTSLSLQAGSCLFDSITGLLCKLPTLEKFKLDTDRFLLPHPPMNTFALDSLSNMKEFDIAVEEAPEFPSNSNTVDLLSLIRTSSSLSWLNVQGLGYSPITVDFPIFWPSLRYYKHDGIVNDVLLRSWAEYPYWPLSLVSLHIHMHNLKSNWLELLRVLETHRSLESCVIALKVDEHDDVQDLSEQQTLFLNAWDPQRAANKLDWKHQVVSSSQDEIAHALYVLSPDERTLDNDPSELRRVVQSILAHRLPNRVGFAVFLWKELHRNFF